MLILIGLNCIVGMGCMSSVLPHLTLFRLEYYMINYNAETVMMSLWSLFSFLPHVDLIIPLFLSVYLPSVLPFFVFVSFLPSALHPFLVFFSPPSFLFLQPLYRCNVCPHFFVNSLCLLKWM